MPEPWDLKPNHTKVLAKIFAWAYECDLDIELRKCREEMGLSCRLYPELRFRNSFNGVEKQLVIRGDDFGGLLFTVVRESDYIAAKLSRPPLDLDEDEL